MPDQYVLEYTEVEKRLLPDLYKFVVAIAHENEDGDECLGSGVLVNLEGRHFIATAKHVMERNPRVMHRDFIMVNDRLGTDNPIKILKSELHSLLDVGFLEIEVPPSSEITQDQICFQSPSAGCVWVIGHPACRFQRIQERREFIITRCSFSTTIREVTNDYWKLHYSVDSVRPENGAWVKGPPMLDVPGFSGGGCFGITKTVREGLEVIEYKLLGIQCSWHKGERWVKVVPIRHWFDKVTQVL
jgi:hypothetical protein